MLAESSEAHVESQACDLVGSDVLPMSAASDGLGRCREGNRQFLDSHSPPTPLALDTLELWRAERAMLGLW